MDILDVCSTLSLGSGKKLNVDFIGKGNLWINNTYNASVNQLARYVLCEAIFSTAPGQLSILGYDGSLSGVFAPFAALSAGESRILEFITDEKQLLPKLKELQQQILATQNVIQGREDSLIEFRKSVQRPIESYQLVVLAMDMGLIGKELMVLLSRLMRSDPAFGISFLIVSTTYLTMQTSDGRELERSIRNDLKSNATNISHESDEIQNTIAMLDQLLSGAISGIGDETIGQCQKALRDLTQALQKVDAAAACVDRLKSTEEMTTGCLQRFVKRQSAPSTC